MDYDEGKIIDANYDIFLSSVGGIIYPPDDLNINENSLKIIKETLTGDDIILKYFEIIKSIEIKWISFKHFQRSNTTTTTNLDINHYLKLIKK